MSNWWDSLSSVAVRQETSLQHTQVGEVSLESFTDWIAARIVARAAGIEVELDAAARPLAWPLAAVAPAALGLSDDDAARILALAIDGVRWRVIGDVQQRAAARLGNENFYRMMQADYEQAQASVEAAKLLLKKAAGAAEGAAPDAAAPSGTSAAATAVWY